MKVPGSPAGCTPVLELTRVPVRQEGSPPLTRYKQPHALPLALDFASQPLTGPNTTHLGPELSEWKALSSLTPLFRERSGGGSRWDIAMA